LPRMFSHGASVERAPDLCELFGRRRACALAIYN
jgi:hypothetical protein